MKKKIRITAILMLICLCISPVSEAQSNKELRFNFNDSGSRYIKATFTAQIWGRYTENNPGSTVFGYEQDTKYDIGLRRVRAQFYGMVHEKVFLYTQLGINNFNDISARKSPVFFHDVAGEYYVMPRSLHLGMGLSAWTGFARFSSPSVATIMGYDAPLAQQATNDANDQFLRKLSVYAKGKLGRFDYRLILSDPMAVLNSSVVSSISINSDFSLKPPKLQSSGYFIWQFMDEESNLTPYMTGTYLGKKKILNLGAGFQYQPKAMWRWKDTASLDTVFDDMQNFAVDLYFDHPVGNKGSAISAYAAFIHFGFGKGYLRNLAVMNPANGVAAGTNSMNGAGNGYPMIGTGNLVQAQIGYLLPKKLLGDNNGQLQAYGMLTYADYERLADKMLTYDLGLNWYIDGYRSKLSFNYQNRPVFRASDTRVSERKGMYVLQFQIAI